MEVWGFTDVSAAQQMQDTSKLAEIIEGGATFERCQMDWAAARIQKHTVAGWI